MADIIVFCCGKGCGECNSEDGVRSNCCDAPVFLWDTEQGVVVQREKEGE